MSRPRFAVFYRQPEYCNRDSIIGWNYWPVRYCNTYAFALAVACKANGDYEDDAGYEVRHWRENPHYGWSWTRIWMDPASVAEYEPPPPIFADDEIPF